MELQEFISSGVLESYVLGTATTEEIRTIREMEKLYPAEMRAEIEDIELSLMRYAEMNSGSLSPATRSAIESALFEEQTVPVNKKGTVVNISSLSGPSRYLRFAVAASIGLLIGVSAFTYTLYNALNKVKTELGVLQTENEVLGDEMGKQQDEIRQHVKELNDKRIELAMIMKPGSKVVMLKGMDLSPESHAMVIWNTKDKQVYINAASLPPPPEGKQYQLWAMVNGKPVDAGVFSMTDGSFIMQQMKDMPEAHAFAVTLENAGGSPVPTMDAMYLLGNV